MSYNENTCTHKLLWFGGFRVRGETYSEPMIYKGIIMAFIFIANYIVVDIVLFDFLKINWREATSIILRMIKVNDLVKLSG